MENINPNDYIGHHHCENLKCEGVNLGIVVLNMNDLAMNIYLHNKLQQVDQDKEVNTTIKISLLNKPEHIVTLEASKAILMVDVEDDPSW